MRGSKHNKKVIVDDKEIKYQTHILKCIREFSDSFQKTQTKNCGRN